MSTKYAILIKLCIPSLKVCEFCLCLNARLRTGTGSQDFLCLPMFFASTEISEDFLSIPTVFASTEECIFKRKSLTPLDV